MLGQATRVDKCGGLKAIRNEIWEEFRVLDKGTRVDKCFLRFVEFATRPRVLAAATLEERRR
jgi:hypothetical protein